MAALTARELVLSLVDTTEAADLGAAYLVSAGELFDIDPRSIRVALARLVKHGVLAQPERGRYALGNRAGTLRSLVRNWSRVEEMLAPWRGGWITVLAAHLSRSDRARLRRRERALELGGFAAAARGLWVRPDNLAETLEATRDRLVALGLDTDAVLIQAAAFAPAGTVTASALWDRRALERRYRSHIAALDRSTERLAGLDHLAAVRETLLVGRPVTRAILMDPLLPDELVDARLRRQMIERMRAYDRAARRLWARFYRDHAGR